MEHKFTKHLIEIGFIDKKTESQILSLYKNNYYKFYKPNKLIFNELMTEILLSIINNFTEMQKKYICFHLPAKFINLMNKNLQDKLINILRKKEIKNKLIMSKFLFKWYRNKNKSKKIISIDKNIFRKKSKQTNISINNITNKNYLNSNIKDFLFNDNNNNDNIIIKNYQSNLSTINNEKKNKSLQNAIKRQINKTPKKITFLYNKNILNSNDINFLNNNIFNDKTISTKENKRIYTNNNNYINQIKKDLKKHYKKCSNNDTIISGLRDSNESNENCLSTNLNTINNRYNNNQENKTLSQSEYIPNYDISNYNNYSSKTFKKNRKIYCKSKSLINQTENNYQQKSNIKNNKKNKSNLIQNILYEDFQKNLSISPIEKSKTKKIYDNNIYNLIYSNNYNNLNNNNKDYNDEYLYNYRTPFCQTIKNSKSNKEYSTCKRLFEEGKERIKKQNQKKRERDKIFDEMASRASGGKKTVNFKRINDLYKSKERSNTYEKTKSKVEQEEGLTFKPLVNKSEYSKRIFGNFIERNLMNDSKEKCHKDYKNINGSKKLNKKQKEIIVNGVINRLYTNSLMKSMSTYCNKYSKGTNNTTNLIPYRKKLSE